MAQGHFIPNQYNMNQQAPPQPWRNSPPQNRYCVGGWVKDNLTDHWRGSSGPQGSGNGSATGMGVTPPPAPQWRCLRWSSIDSTKKYSENYARLNCGGLNREQCERRFEEEQQDQETDGKQFIQEAAVQNFDNGQR